MHTLSSGILGGALRRGRDDVGESSHRVGCTLKRVRWACLGQAAPGSAGTLTSVFIL